MAAALYVSVAACAFIVTLSVVECRRAAKSGQTSGIQISERANPILAALMASTVDLRTPHNARAGIQGRGYLLPSGVILTVAHVVRGASEPLVCQQTGAALSQVLRSLNSADILALGVSQIPSCPLEKTATRPGERLYILALSSNSLKELLVVKNENIPTFIDAATGREKRLAESQEDLASIDVIEKPDGDPIRPGYSGSPVFNSSGKCVGLLSSYAKSSPPVSFITPLSRLDPAQRSVEFPEYHRRVLMEDFATLREEMMFFRAAGELCPDPAHLPAQLTIDNMETLMLHDLDQMELMFGLAGAQKYIAEVKAEYPAWYDLFQKTSFDSKTSP